MAKYFRLTMFFFSIHAPALNSRSFHWYPLSKISICMCIINRFRLPSIFFYFLLSVARFFAQHKGKTRSMECKTLRLHYCLQDSFLVAARTNTTQQLCARVLFRFFCTHYIYNRWKHQIELLYLLMFSKKNSISFGWSWKNVLNKFKQLNNNNNSRSKEKARREDRKKNGEKNENIKINRKSDSGIHECENK